MTLSELTKKFFSCPTLPGPGKVYIFRDEESADNWMLLNYIEESVEAAYSLLAVYQSDSTIECVFKEKWCTAEIQQFYAPATDTLVVVLKEAWAENKRIDIDQERRSSDEM